MARSLAWEKSEISEYIKAQLSKDKKLFGFVAKGDRATELERAGNKIDVEKSKEISTGAAQAAEVYDKLSTKGGPISAILDDAARKLADGQNAATTKADAYKAVRSEVSKTLGGAQGEVSEGLEEGTGSGKAGEDTSLYSEAIAPTFYSKAERVAEQKVSTGPGNSPEAQNEIANQSRVSVVQPTNEAPKYVRANQYAMQLIMEANGHRFRGVNMSLGDAYDTIDELRRYRDSGNLTDQRAKDNITSLVETLYKGLHYQNGLNIVKASSDPAQELHTIMEEQLHAVHRGSGAMADDPEQMLKDPGIQALAEGIKETQTRNPKSIVAEGVADVLLGDGGLNHEQAESTAKHYAGLMASQHGIENVEKLRAVYDHADQWAAEHGLVKPGEQYDPEGTRAGRSAVNSILARRGGKGAARRREEVRPQSRNEGGVQNDGLESREGGRNAGGTEGGLPALRSTQPVGLTDDELADWAKSLRLPL